jgi:SAM-dependent methyltransferase
VAEDPRVRAYFDDRARPFDRLYDRRSGARGRFEEWAYRPIRWSLELTCAELGDLTGKSVLDVGCGPGRYAVVAADRGAQVVGVDVSPAMLTLARRHARDQGLEDSCRFVEADFDAYEPGATFDVVLMMSFLEYRPDPARDIKRLRALTREKAMLRVPWPGDWRTFARRFRHRIRGSPPAFFVHDPATIAVALGAAGFDHWRSERGWFVAYERGGPPG